MALFAWINRLWGDPPPRPPPAPVGLAPRPPEPVGPPPPGLFAALVREGRLPREALTSLEVRLPEAEHVERKPGLETFILTRWPASRDLALARRVAARLPDPDGRIVAALATPPGALAELRRAAGTAFAAQLAAASYPRETFRTVWPDSDREQEAPFDQPPLPAAQARALADLALCAYSEAEGLFAFHAFRGLSGPAADAAASLAREALDTGVLDVAGLVALAEEVLDEEGEGRG